MTTDVATDLPPVPYQCQEDSPDNCWDCSTMGNQICGPGAVGSLTYQPSGYLPQTGASDTIAIGGSVLLLLGVLAHLIARRPVSRGVQPPKPALLPSGDTGITLRQGTRSPTFHWTTG